MKNDNSLEVSFTCLYHFRVLLMILMIYFLANFGDFQRFWKNQEIEHGGSNMVAKRHLTSPTH